MSRPGSAVTYKTCPYCEREMAPGNACTLIRYEGEALDRIPYQMTDVPPDHVCHDCNVPLGALHHPGCDMERCPACGGQAISCPCTDKENNDD